VRVNGERIQSEARALAFPRCSGSEGDVRAIEMVAGWLREAGLEVSCEEFTYDISPAFRALRLLLLGTGLLVTFAGILAQPLPQIAASCLTLALLAGGILLLWSPWLEWLYSREGSTRTANVIGRSGPRPPRLSLIFVAHHDSKSQNLTLLTRAGLTILTLVGSLALAGLLIVGLAMGRVPGPPWLGPLLGGLAAASLATLSTLQNGNHSPGGVDNAGSVGILMELARILPGELPADVEAIFLSTGAEEDHMVGAMRWLDRHISLLAGRPTYALNLDGAGIPGKALLLERYGLGKSFSPYLSRMARRAAERLEIPLRGSPLPPALGVDAIPFVHRGIPCITFASGSLGRAVAAIHSADDHAENLDRGALERVARLVAATALDLTR
jgi:acetylornithine deacetylase/succinyl-diaminopimelate desuccinylase-like protein